MHTTKVVCRYCSDELSFHQSTSLKYQLQAKHVFGDKWVQHNKDPLKAMLAQQKHKLTMQLQAGKVGNTAGAMQVR